MSYTHSRVGSKDANHDEIVKAFEAIGCNVFDVHHVPGFVDLVVGSIGRTFLVEIKNVDGKDRMSPKQQTFHRDWRGGQPWTVRNAEDVYRLIGEIRRAAR